jgi:hypothetical protein
MTDKLVSDYLSSEGTGFEWFNNTCDPAQRFSDVNFLTCFGNAFVESWPFVTETSKTDIITAVQDLHRAIDQQLPRISVLIKLQTIESLLLNSINSYCTTVQYRMFLTRFLGEMMEKYKTDPLKLDSLRRNQISLAMFFDRENSRFVVLTKYMICEFDATDTLMIVPKAIKEQFQNRFVYFFDIAQLGLTMSNVVDIVAFEAITHVLAQ